VDERSLPPPDTGSIDIQAKLHRPRLQAVRSVASHLTGGFVAQPRMVELFQMLRKRTFPVLNKHFLSPPSIVVRPASHYSLFA